VVIFKINWMHVLQKSKLNMIPFMTNGHKLAVCLGDKKVPMLDKFDERLESFDKENVLHAND